MTDLDDTKKNDLDDFQRRFGGRNTKEYPKATVVMGRTKEVRM